MKPRSIHFSAVFALGWVALSAIGLGACATPAPRGLEVELLQDAQVSGLEGAAKGLKKGQKLRAGSQTYLVESPG